MVSMTGTSGPLEGWEQFTYWYTESLKTIVPELNKLTYNLCVCFLCLWYVLPLAGEHGSACHGSVIQGQFEGTIYTGNGTYHIESVQRYSSSPTDYHSIIYHEDDMGKTKHCLQRCFSTRAKWHSIPQITFLDLCKWWESAQKNKFFASLGFHLIHRLL